MARAAKKLTARECIDRLVKRIVTKFHPEKIILFGSQARGDAGPDSDFAKQLGDRHNTGE
jgi:predicted nucleotidyltransferase